MLTKSQKTELHEMPESSNGNHRAFRKRILDSSVRSVDDLIFVFQHSDRIPDLKRRIPPGKIEQLTHSYFQAFKVSPKYSDPTRVIQLLDEIAVLQRKNASLTQEMGDMIHQIEHFKYVATHSTELLEMERARSEGFEIVTRI